MKNMKTPLACPTMAVYSQGWHKILYLNVTHFPPIKPFITLLFCSFSTCLRWCLIEFICKFEEWKNGLKWQPQKQKGKHKITTLTILRVKSVLHNLWSKMNTREKKSFKKNDKKQNMENIDLTCYLQKYLLSKKNKNLEKL